MACIKLNRPKIFRIAKIYLIIFITLTIVSLIWCFYSAINQFIVFINENQNGKGNKFTQENVRTEVEFILTIVLLCMIVMICFFGYVCVIKNNFWLMILYIFSLVIACAVSIYRNYHNQDFAYLFLDITFIGSFISACFYARFFKHQNQNQKSTSDSDDTQERSFEMITTTISSGSCEQNDAIPNTSSNSESNAPPNIVTNVPLNSLSNESDSLNQLSNASPNVSPTTRLDIEQLISLFAPREPPPAYDTVYPQALNEQSPESQELYSHHRSQHHEMFNHQHHNQHHHALPHNFTAQTSQTNFQNASHHDHEVHHSHLQAQNLHPEHRQINSHEFPLQTQNHNSLNRRNSCPQFQTRESHPQISRQNSIQQFRVHEMHSQFNGHEIQSQFINQNSNIQDQGLHSQYKVYGFPSQHHNVHDHLQSHQPSFYKY